MEKILLVRNKRKMIKLTYKKNIKKIAKENNVEIIEISNVELWKKINSGTLDKNIKKIWMVSKDYQLAKYLEKKGYIVFNNSKSIEICDNKGLQYIYIEDFMPKTHLCPLIYNVKDISEKDFSDIKYPCILKKFYSSFGKGVYKINNKKELIIKIKEINTYLFLIQEFINTSDSEYSAISYRVSVIGNKIVAIMKNCSKKDYRTQTIYGGEHYKIDLPNEVKKMVIKATKKIGNDFAGVDIIQDNRTKKWYISEINGSGGMELLSKLYKREIAEDIIKYIKSK